MLLLIHDGPGVSYEVDGPGFPYEVEGPDEVDGLEYPRLPPVCGSRQLNIIQSSVRGERERSGGGGVVVVVERREGEEDMVNT